MPLKTIGWISWKPGSGSVAGLRASVMRVADLHLGGGLDVGDDVADVAGVAASSAAYIFGREDADFLHLVASCSLLIIFIAVAGLDRAATHAHVGDHAAVGVEDRIEDQRAQLSSVGTSSAAGCGATTASRISSMPMPALALARIASSAGMARMSSSCRLHRRDVGVRQVDLVDDRDDLETLLDREVDVGDGLRLDALRGVDDEQRAFARGERARDFVGEIHVARRVHEVELVGLRRPSPCSSS